VFNRVISIDWSGGEAKTDQDRVSLRVAVWEKRRFRIEPPPDAKYGRRKWTREECRDWLCKQLKVGESRTLVALDFGFGLPWGSDRAVFQVVGWREMVARMAEVYARHGTARKTAEDINLSLEGDRKHAPFRLSKKDRTHFQFYLEEGVGYFRLTEIAAPQAISQWYLGAGPKVGYHTIRGCRRSTG
jgi:hypothetical protein